MKVLQINTINNSGSTGRITESIGNTIFRNGGKSYIAIARNFGRSKSIEYKVGNKIDLISHVFLTRLFDKHGYGSKKSTRKMIDWIRKINPDIIHLHNLHGYYINFPLLFSFIKESRLTVVWTLHDCWPFTGHCTYFDSVNCDKWKTRCFSCPKTNFYPESWFIDRSEKNFIDKKRVFTGVDSLAIVTPSKWLKSHVQKSFLSDYNTHFIHNGVNLNVFKPVEEDGIIDSYALKGFDIILGVASIWDSRKGLKDFELLVQGLDRNYKVVLVGLSNKQIEKLPEEIVGISRTEDIYELAQWYSVAKVYINPTYQDNFPTTNIEALACGTPVITYDTGGSIESIDEETGIVVEKGNINGLINAVNGIVHSKELYSSQQCRKRAEKYFNKEERFQDYFNLYKEILQKKGKS